jgi:hypothetical protein
MLNISKRLLFNCSHFVFPYFKVPIRYGAEWRRWISCFDAIREENPLIFPLRTRKGRAFQTFKPWAVNPIKCNLVGGASSSYTPRALMNPQVFHRRCWTESNDPADSTVFQNLSFLSPNSVGGSHWKFAYVTRRSRDALKFSLRARRWEGTSGGYLKVGKWELE